MSREHNRRPPTQGQPSMAEFARKVAEGVAGARDRFNNPITRGHMVTYRPEVDAVFEVLDIAPILDPRQLGMVKLTLSTTIPLRIPVNQPIMRLVIIGMVPQEAQPVMPAAPPAPEGPLADGPRLVLTDAPLTDAPPVETINDEPPAPPPPTDADAPPEPVDHKD